MSESGFSKAAEGKTKAILLYLADPNICDVLSSDRITAGDGKRSDVIEGKGALSNQVACNVWRLLQRRGIPVAFKEQNGPTSFVASFCDMIPLEIVVRYRAGEASSYRKRYPDVPANCDLRRPVVEFFLKTTGRTWKGHTLPCDDHPFLSPFKGENGYAAFLPNKPPASQTPLLHVTDEELGLRPGDRKILFDIAEQTGSVLRAAWDSVGARLDDFKMECGRDPSGRVVGADLLDHDSWRLLYRGEDLSKQPYRDGASLPEVYRKFKLATELSERFPD